MTLKIESWSNSKIQLAGLLLGLILLALGASCQPVSDATPTPAEGTPPTSDIAVTSVVLTPTADSRAEASPTAAGPTATPIPGLPTATAIPSPTAVEPAMPLPTPGPLVDFYEVQPGDTLGGISWNYNVPLDTLLALNNFDSDNVIINVGQTIRVPLELSRTGPAVILLPDSELVYSPAYLEFDVAAYLSETHPNGYLAQYETRVNGRLLNGAEVVELVAEQFSVGPRVLLAVLEFYGGWVTQPELLTRWPVGAANPYGESLYRQLGWLANRLNAGYYGYKLQGQLPVTFRDRGRALIPPGLNAGTAGVQNLLALNVDGEAWERQAGQQGFIRTYQRLFGDPFAYAIEPLIPASLSQPEMRLPWQNGVMYYYTGGPHGAYSDGSIGAAIDFGPPDVLGSCFYSQEYITAAAEGRVIFGEVGEIHVDLDFDGDLRTGWVLFYLHVVPTDDLRDGQVIPAGSPLGFASCEGGLSNATHLHLARRYNGEWLHAAGPVPLVLSGWQVTPGASPYEGGLVRGDEIRTAGEFQEPEINGVVGE